MSVFETETLDPWIGHQGEHSSTEEEPDAGSLSASEVIQRVNEILGYDVFEMQLMAEGYREFGAESLTLSEEWLTAGSELLPPEPDHPSPEAD